MGRSSLLSTPHNGRRVVFADRPTRGRVHDATADAVRSDRAVAGPQADGSTQSRGEPKVGQAVTPTVTITVFGTPAPKGSNRAMVRGGRAVFVPGGSKQNQSALMTWDQNVRHSASQACSGADGPVFVQRPISVSLEFRLARPGGHYAKDGTIKRTAPSFPAVKPDVDKLSRATLDSLTGIVWCDDSRIVKLRASKDYVDKAELAGVTIFVRTVP